MKATDKLTRSLTLLILASLVGTAGDGPSGRYPVCAGALVSV